MSLYSHKTASPLLAKADLNTAILVFGGTEQCGPCLPCNIDSLVADFLADYCAKELKAYRTPVFPYNTSQEHGSRAGTLSLSAALMQNVTESLIQQLVPNGFDQFVLLSPHGGAYWEPVAIKELNAAYPEITLISAKDGAALALEKARQAAGLEDAQGIHGGWIPLCTAALLEPEAIIPGTFGTLKPEQVPMAFNYGLLDAYSADGSWGEPIEVKTEDIPAYAEKGRLFWTTFAELQCKRIAKVLDDVSTARSQLLGKK